MEASGLKSLIERTEKATGPDREIDGAILRALGYTWRGMEYWRDNPSQMWVGPVQFTSSVDAALALVEKMRPGYRWGVSSVAIKIGAYPDGKTAYGDGFRAHVTKNSPLRPMPSTADAPTPALAIILALLRALDSQGVEE